MIGDIEREAHQDTRSEADELHAAGCVVAGLDGSECSELAAAWAATEADRRGLGLLLAYALPLPDPAFVPAAAIASDEHRHSEARELLEREAEALRKRFPGLAIDTLIREESPADFLGALSKAAALLVTGSRGHGGFAGMLVGSVSRKLAAHASCPLVVVRGEPSSDVRDEVVLGIGPKPSPAALRFAFQAAREYGATLSVARAWWVAGVYGGLAVPAGMYVNQHDTFRASAQAGAEESVRPFIAEFPDVKVRVAAPEGNTVPALVDAARGARLLVVGAHHHRGPLSVGAGYVVEGVIAHGTTPVAVVPIH